MKRCSYMYYKKIFVPIDDSNTSLLALKEAIALAKLSGGLICVAHVVDFAEPNWGTAANVQTGGNLKNIAKEMADKAFVQAREMLMAAGVPYKEIALETLGSKVANVLSEEAVKQECDIIVMGTHGRSGMMGLLMGSVAEGVLKKSSLPVMMVKPTA